MADSLAMRVAVICSVTIYLLAILPERAAIATLWRFFSVNFEARV
jgi:hypothetical protein